MSQHELPNEKTDTRVDGLPKPDQQSDLSQRGTRLFDPTLTDDEQQILQAMANEWRALYAAPCLDPACPGCLRDRAQIYALLETAFSLGRARSYALGLRDGRHAAQQEDLAHTAKVQREAPGPREPGR